MLTESAAGAAGEEPICADRPGLATPTCTVPAGMIQVETTVADWTRDRSGSLRSDDIAIGESALKLGVSERFHVEAVIAPYVRSRVREDGLRDSALGFGDLSFAAKYRLTSDVGPVQVAVRPFVKIPTAKRPLGNRRVEGGVIVPIEYAVPGTQLSVALSPQLDVLADSEGSGHHLAMAQVVGIGVPLSSRLSASGELWAARDWDPAGTVRQYAFGGSTAYLLSKNVQIDAGVNLGLNRATPDLQLYSGVAFRF
jgi:hypothetical protein